MDIGISSLADSDSAVRAILRGGRMVLRPATVMDADSLFRLCWSDPAVMRYQNVSIHRRLSDSVARLQTCEAAWRGGVPHYRVIVASDDAPGQPIGLVWCIRHESGMHKLGYALGRQYWGRGYATEAARLVIEEVGRTESGAVIEARCARANPASAAVLQKLGFRRERSIIDPASLPNLPNMGGAIRRVVDVHRMKPASCNDNQFV